MTLSRSLTTSAVFVAVAWLPCHAGQTTRLSVSSAGAQANNDSYLAAVSSTSADATYVAFESRASNLVAGDTNGTSDIFVRNRWTGTTTRVSVSSAGAQANGGSYQPSISADGRYIAFYSHATNLVAGDTNAAADIFVHDTVTGQTTRVSVSSAGAQANGDSYAPCISAYGRYVAFESYASNLVSGDTNGRYDVFVHDRNTGQTTRVSVSSAGAEGNGNSYAPSINRDGDLVAFESYASNLVASDTNSASDIFVRDTIAGTTTRVSVSSAGAQGNADSYSASISAMQGRYVAFASYASNLVTGDTNGWHDIFVHDRSTGQTTRVSVSSTGQEANNYSRAPSISYNGQYVGFDSYASNLVADDTNSLPDIFLHDRDTGQTTRVSVSSSGQQANGASYDCSLTDGSGYVYIAFESDATNLVSADTNAQRDIFLHVREPIPGDMDRDGDVDLDDYDLFASAMNGPNQTPGNPDADLDGDGDCDLADFGVFAANFTGAL